MPRITTLEVGQTGMSVSSVGLGTAHLGGGGMLDLVPEAQGRDTVQAPSPWEFV
jgi:aryl-alcohol dehydrogenase-like predicted oxidoreductase